MPQVEELTLQQKAKRAGMSTYAYARRMRNRTWKGKLTETAFQSRAYLAQGYPVKPTVAGRGKVKFDWQHGKPAATREARSRQLRAIIGNYSKRG